MNSWGAKFRFWKMLCLAGCEVAIFASFLSAQTSEHVPESRPLCCVGYHYPAQQSELYSQVEAFIKLSPSAPAFDDIQAIFVPSAPYIYVGSFFGRAYSAIVGRRYDRIVILGTDPTATAPAVYSGAEFVTPLGRLPSDDEAIGRLLAKCPVKFERVAPRFPLPSSIEGQLPFIQYIYGKRPIVAIGLAGQTSDEARAIGHAIAEVFDDGKTLIVGAVNLSESRDSRSCEGMDKLLLDRLDCLAIDKMAVEFDQGRIQASSAAVVLAASVAAREMGANHVEVMRYANSAGIIGDGQSVVGYMAAAVGVRNDSKVCSSKALMSKTEGEYYLWIARRAISARLNVRVETGQPAVEDRGLSPDGVYLAIFSDGKLRGGVASLFPSQALPDAVANVAVSAAFNDPRFNPLSADELDKVTIKLYIMTDARRVDSPEDFDPSKDVIFVRRGSYSTMILPGELNPDLKNKDLLGRACLKAGLLSNCWRQNETSVWRFEVQEFEEKR